jgi:hypothetical protein
MCKKEQIYTATGLRMWSPTIFLLPKSFFTGGGEKNVLLLMALKCA